RMFGFTFLENFNYPYISRSIREFWRRWHISLSTWLRDYLYIPLGGSRVSTSRMYLNLWTVFLLCGLWHGASWNFVIWGAIHGMFLVLERIGLEKILNRLWLPFRHAYMLLVVVVAWVFFRIESLPEALNYVRVMAGLGSVNGTEHSLSAFLPREKMYIFLAAAAASIPLKQVLPLLKDRIALFVPGADRLYRITATGFTVVEPALLIGMLVFSIMLIAVGTYNPFIYFRF
ncbi:MAG TPA: MBOAT family protein, partial [Thermodesulfobacteriaceae bacterium]|nr:MBOAT family protein [Thermodesulfobacteriaceae bacterium]